MPVFRCSACGATFAHTDDMAAHAAEAHAGQPLSRLMTVEADRRPPSIGLTHCGRCAQPMVPIDANVQLCPTCKAPKEPTMPDQPESTLSKLTALLDTAIDDTPPTTPKEPAMTATPDATPAPKASPVEFKMPGTVLDILLADDLFSASKTGEMVGASPIGTAGGGKFARIGCTKQQATSLAGAMARHADALQALPAAEKKAHPSGNVQGRIRNLRHTEQVIRALLAGEEPPPRVANPGARKADGTPVPSEPDAFGIGGATKAEVDRTFKAAWAAAGGKSIGPDASAELRAAHEAALARLPKRASKKA